MKLHKSKIMPRFSCPLDAMLGALFLFLLIFVKTDIVFAQKIENGVIGMCECRRSSLFFLPSKNQSNHYLRIKSIDSFTISADVNFSWRSDSDNTRLGVAKIDTIKQLDKNKYPNWYALVYDKFDTVGICREPLDKNINCVFYEIREFKILVSWNGVVWFHFLPNSLKFDNENAIFIKQKSQHLSTVYSTRVPQFRHNLESVDIDLSYDKKTWYHILGEGCYSNLKILP